jgi:hypothetical protein
MYLPYFIYGGICTTTTTTPPLLPLQLHIIMLSLSDVPDLKGDGLLLNYKLLSG